MRFIITELIGNFRGMFNEERHRHACSTGNDLEARQNLTGYTMRDE